VPVTLDEDLERAKSDVAKILQDALSSKKYLTKDKTSLLEKTEIQALLQLKLECPVKNALFRLIVDDCFLSEKMAPGSFFETLELALSKKTSSREEKTYHPTSKNLLEIIEKNASKNMHQIIFDAVNFAGYGGKISIEKSLNDKISLEVKDAQEFFCKTFEKKPLKIENAKVICIDGYIENVSELNKLFIESVERKDQVVIFAAGFHDDIISTIEVNKARRNMFIFPVVVPFDLENINTLADISLISGCTLISSHLGKLISNLDLSDSSIVEEITIFSNLVSIKNSASRFEVEKHIKNLLKKAENSQASELYESRIKRIAGHRVIIRIPDDKDFVSRSSQIDECLRSIKSMLDFGVCESGQLFSRNQISNQLSEKIIKKIENLGSIVYQK
jgi:chaperonin GroEL (HSP60 family)